MSVRVDDLLDRLRGHTGKQPVRRNGYWMARCPLHDDRTASLSISEGAGGKVLTKCHCPTCRGNKPNGYKLIMQELQLDTAQPAGTTGKTCTYTYTGHDGLPVIAVHRIDGPDGKRIWQESLVPGTAIKDLPEASVYRAESLRGNRTEGRVIHISEGEKCADAIAGAWNELSTTVLGGSSRTIPNKAIELFRGADVVIWQDNDQPGASWAAKIARQLDGVARAVEVRLPEGASRGYDVADMIQAGHNSYRIVRHDMAEKVLPIPVNRLSDIKHQPVDWIVPGLIPAGEITLIEGPPGIGKSRLAMAIVAALSIPGGQLPLDCVTSHAQRSWYISTEDRAGTVLKPRVEQMGGNMDLVYATDSWYGSLDEEGMAAFRETAVALKPRVIVIDAFLDVMLPAMVDDSPRSAKPILRAVRDVAVELNAAVLAVRHITKASAHSPTMRLEDGYGGSHYSQAARSQIRVFPIAGAMGVAGAAQIKSNYGPLSNPFGVTTTGNPMEPVWVEIQNHPSGWVVS